MEPQPLPPQPSTSPESTPVIQPAKPPSKPPVTIILFSVAILCFLGFLLYQNVKLQKQIADMRVTPPSQIPPITSISPTASQPQENPSTDWKIYTNQTYGYSVTYPTSWQTSLGDNGATTNFYLSPSDREFISITVHENPSSTEIHSWLIAKSIIPDPNNISTHIQQEDVLIDDIKSVKVLTPANGGQTTVYIPKGNKVFSVYNNVNSALSTTESDLAQNSKIMNKILSTFRFLESPLSPMTTTSVLNLTHTIPPGWTTSSDPTSRFQVSFDPNTTQVFEGGATGFNLNKKTRNNDQVGYISFIGVELFAYTGGSKHQFIYAHMNNGKPPTKQDYMSGYKETEYLYMGRTCLFLNGISISQFPTVWGMCDAGNSQAFLITAYDREDYLQTVSTIKKIQ